MINLLNALTALGSVGAENALALAGESAIKKYKDSHMWKKLLVGNGEFYKNFEHEENDLFHDLKLALSKDNLSSIAKELEPDDGYGLKHRLYDSLMQLMKKYEIPYEYAESYTIRIIYGVLEQLRYVSPVKYEQYFLQDWRDEQEKCFEELQTRIDKISRELTVYHQDKIAIESAGQLDIKLRRSTQNPSIGIEFFLIDDEHFQEDFEEHRNEEIIYVRGRNREETVYCILNELWRLNEKRPIYVVKSMESWNNLRDLSCSGNIYIPWFYADAITPLENNTNIFIADENTPLFNRNILELRPRTRETLLKCLCRAGLEHNKAYALLEDTHGLYSQIKKRLFRGEYLKEPAWIKGISEKAKKTCLLIGSWEEIDGDKLIIESLYDNSYDQFIEEVLPYTRGDDPLLYMINRNGSVSYYLACVENIWSYLDVYPTEPIWQSFISAVLNVLNEAENLFTYDHHESLMAQFKGEKLFWSETIRKGMLKTLLVKAAYQKGEKTQQSLNELVSNILDRIKTEKQWRYIAKFWKELCEISPKATLERLENEFVNETGLLSLFQNQSGDFLFGRNAYIEILWGVEQFLTQRDYYWQAFRWLLRLDSYHFEYRSNSTKDILSKIYCIWANYSSLQNAEEKLSAAKLAFEINPNNTWDYLLSAIDYNGRTILGELSYPKYREHEVLRPATKGDMQKAYQEYFDLLKQHMDYSAFRWSKLIDSSANLGGELRHEVIAELLSEINQMPDEDVMKVKNRIRRLLYRHRFYSSTEWALSEEILSEYEELLGVIKLNTPEYEYSYLFKNTLDNPLLHPMPYQQEGAQEINRAAKEKLIQKKLLEFQDCGYNLTVLAIACAQKSDSTLGYYLAKYWNSGKWDYEVFRCLLTAQNTGTIALSYLANCAEGEFLPFEAIISDLSAAGFSSEMLAKVYRIEAQRAKQVPLVSKAPEAIKKEFWKNRIDCDKCNDTWVLKECKKYAALDVYLDQIYMIHYQKALSAEQILACFDGIEYMSQSGSNQMTSYHVEQLMSELQKKFIDDGEKCIRISHLEVFFLNLLKWENMKCFQKMIKQLPELFAQLVNSVFKKDHPESDKQQRDQAYINNMFSIYEKAHFCPAEVGGIVDEKQLEEWIEDYRQYLVQNDQISLFTSTLGRLFSFSPAGVDGREPCEAVRNMIEKYGDDRMINSYQIAVYNRRGLFTPSAGREELKMAEEFRENAQYLEPHYPITAKIYYGLYETYQRESKREREDAENGW